MERHVLESLLAGDDEASVIALATLRNGATYWVGDRAQPAGQHAGVFKLRLQRMRMHGLEPRGLERAVQLVREHGRPVRTGFIDSADRTWTTLLFLTEDGSALVACAGWQLPLVVRMLKFIHAQYEADNHAYAEVSYRFGGDALLDSHLPMLDLVNMLARDYAAMDPTDPRFAGLTYALRVLAQSYAEHPEYREQWRP
ncbi:DUF6221 family protein [Streptomyces sp. NPDC059909]|uniref:DUF6221 family protein n=1 Tax=Streptomyces sp. NPDC059909 TaxID=3346998 RepID=UPI003664C830